VTRTTALLTAGVVAAIGLYAALAARWVSHDSGWYASLAKPAWQPPDVAFAIAWPYNFSALLVAGVVLVGRNPPAWSARWLLLLTVSAGCAVGWSYLFYVPHRLATAAIFLAAAAMLTWVLAFVAWRAVAWVGLLLVPYALWLTIAAALASAYAHQPLSP
jgi:translocator protein